MLTPEALALVEIGVTTKNRWDDLRDMLTKIDGFGWGELRILIFDDGSDHACPFDVSAICRRAELRRFDESKGLIVRRNQLAGAMAAPYYLSLDDDSFPAGGSLQAAVEFAQSCEDLLGVSFPVYNPKTGQHQVKSLQETPYQVRSFIGCGHLLRRDRFLELGGYREELVHFFEEGELAARAFQSRFYCYHFPGLQIHHMESSAGRNWHRMDYYGARNTVLWNDWYLPHWHKLNKQARAFLARVLLFLRTGRKAHLQGQFAGFKDIARYKGYRRPMPRQMYAQWLALPAD